MVRAALTSKSSKLKVQSAGVAATLMLINLSFWGIMGFYETEASIATQPHEQKTSYPRLDFVEAGMRLYNRSCSNTCR